MPDQFLYNDEVLPADVVLTDPTQLASGPSFTLTSAVVQAPATCTAVLVETFAGVGGSTQARPTIAGTLAETFSAVTTSTQARPILSATLSQTFRAIASSTQVASLTATLTQTFTGTATSTQARPTCTALVTIPAVQMTLEIVKRQTVTVTVQRTIQWSLPV